MSEPRKITRGLKADLLDDSSRGYQFLIYHPAVMLPKESLKNLGYEDNSDGFWLIKKNVDGTISYVVEKYEACGMCIVDFLTDENDKEVLGFLATLPNLVYGGRLHEFVKGNINDDIGMDLAAEIIYG